MKIRIIVLILIGFLVCPNSFALETPIEDLGTIIVTATRIAQNDYKIAGNVTVINKEQIENREPRII